MKKLVLLSILIFSSALFGESYPLLNADLPITYDQGTGTIAIVTANGTQAGALSAANWTAFNNKQAALSFGNLLSGTTGLTVATGTGRLVGGDATVSIQTASGSQPGLLSAADWTTFNAKSPPITKGNLSTTTVGVTVGNGTQAVIGTGTTVDIATASGSQPGILSAGDWTTFNGKQSALTLGNLSSSTGALTVTGGSGAVVGSGTSLSIAVADSSHTGLISATDWTTFNNKQATITTGNLTSPNPAVVIGGGTDSVLGTGTSITIANATASMTGLLSFLDWQAFNAKQAALTFGNLTTSTGAITITGGTGSVVGSGATIDIPISNGAQTGLLSAANWTTFSNKAPLNSPPFTGTPNAPSFALKGSTSGTMTMTVPAVVTDYSIKFPASQGIANTTLVNDGSGNLTWQVGSGTGAVWGDITGTLSSQIDLQAALNLKSNIASPTFTGTPSGPSYGLNGSTSGTLTQSVPVTVTSYTVKWPAAQGAASSVLTNDGSGNLSWGGGAVWGSITGTLSNQTDLQNALDLKAPLNAPTFTGTVTFSSNAVGSLFQGADGTSGTATTFRAGNGTSGPGGAITLSGGNSVSGLGGAFTLQAGATASGTAPDSSIVGSSNSSVGAGGQLSIQAGNNSSSGIGGALILQGGNSATGIGGATTLAAGASAGSAAGGNLTIHGGNSTSGTPGSIIFAYGPTGVTTGLISDEKGNIVIKTGAIATNSTDNFLYLSGMAGIPTGVPTSKTGSVPLVYDTTDNLLYANNGSWSIVNGVNTMAPVGSSPNANGASISGATLTLQPADDTNPGVVTAIDQSFGGVKTINAGVVTQNMEIDGTMLSHQPVILTSDTTTGYTVKLPDAQGAASTVLTNDGTGILTWSPPSVPAAATWVKFPFTYTDFSTAATTNTLTVVAGNHQVISGVVVGVVSPFSGGSASSVVVSLGTDLTSTASLSTNFNIFDASPGDTQDSNTLQDLALYNAESVTITALSVGDTLDNFTDGSIEVWLLIGTLP